MWQIIESSKAWKEAWIAILTHQSRIFSELESLYQPILGAGADYHGHQAVDTPAEILARTTRYRTESEELKRDLAEDVSQVDTRIIHVAQSAKDSLHYMKKTIKKREDRKLDFERYQGRVDNSKNKSKLSERDRTALTKAENELLAATDAYNSADEHLRQVLPPILAAVFSLLPPILAAQIEVQNSLLGHYYTSIHTYCSQEGFPNPAPPMDEVVRTWSDAFLPIQREVESLSIIATGKAVRMPMNLEKNNGLSTNGHRRPSQHSALSHRGHSPSPARALPPSPQYDNKPKISSSPSPSAGFMLSPTEQPAPPANQSPASSSAYQTPMSTFSPAGPNMDYFSRDRQTSTTSNSHTLATPSSVSSLASSVATSTLAIGKKKPPPPPPRQNSNWIFVTALYDFGGQGEGDLVFQEGDKIRVIKQTDSKDDWWQGELRGVKGAFPANYCE
jgi:hypothetical protein